MLTGREPTPPGEKAVTAEEIELAERRAAVARERAVCAGLSAAQSFEDSAIQHERVAKLQDRAVERGVLDVDRHRRSAVFHRKAAEDDRKLAELKRKESADFGAGC
ncbi:hypothetical protein MMAN_25440 [Mycobacterium mantenii]|uniref:Uncharacterized protein n=1 Tax=Mycobacterium mantenii TaxID=560555 RepID=A0A1X0G037_MYCNT|nr:hypothetical protein [Mycobacterium mantenii]MCV7243272.1 hypothetical protein [Mycobacterium mantenii]ORB07346.1 hypothetical protein BST30_07665 [Mycobacterium mantenii]BBY38410.1 hypothetical protein MMAN_25440 [Mycobacterium mantenii]